MPDSNIVSPIRQARIGNAAARAANSVVVSWVLQADAPHQLIKPGNKGRTLLRLLPEMTADGAPLPARRSADEYDFTEWIRSELIAVMLGAGAKKFTALTRVKGSDGSVTSPIDKFLGDMIQSVRQGATGFNPFIVIIVSFFR